MRRRQAKKILLRYPWGPLGHFQLRHPTWNRAWVKMFYRRRAGWDRSKFTEAWSREFWGRGVRERAEKSFRFAT